MSQASLDKFGELLMRKVRDEAVLSWKMMLDGRMKGEAAEKVRSIVRDFSENDKQILSQLVPGIVDTVLHHLLWMAEQELDIQLGIKSADGTEDLRDISDGLPGELYSSDGWIARFSREDRFFY